MNEIELARHGALEADLRHAISDINRSRRHLLNAQEGASRLSPYRHLTFHLATTLDSVEESISHLKSIHREVTAEEEPSMEWAEEEHVNG